MRQTEEPRRVVIGLDLVRFWAAMAVMVYHLAFWSWASPGDLPYRAAGGSVRFESMAPYTWFGWCGVETFFVISGFVICASATRATPYQFLRSRMSRLYPAVWICATITAIAVLVLNLAPLHEVAKTYIRTLAIFCTGPWIDSVYRTLIVEGFFYLLVLSLLLTRAFHVERVAMLLGAYSLALWIATPFVDVTALAPVVVLNFSKYEIFFALGMMIWIIDARGMSPWRAAFVGVLTCFGAFEVYLVALDMHHHVSDQSVFVPVLVWLSSVAAIIVAVFCNAKLHRLVGGWSAFIRFVGLATYPLYLLHDVVGSAMMRTARWVGQEPALGIAMIGSVALACLVVRIEPYLRRPLLACIDAVADRVATLWMPRPFARRRT